MKKIYKKMLLTSWNRLKDVQRTDYIMQFLFFQHKFRVLTCLRIDLSIVIFQQKIHAWYIIFIFLNYHIVFCFFKTFNFAKFFALYNFFWDFVLIWMSNIFNVELHVCASPYSRLLLHIVLCFWIYTLKIIFLIFR